MLPVRRESEVKVTPLDIRRKEFKRSVRGYADEEVDLFLDEVADEFERLYQENVELQERIRRLDEQLATHLQLRDALEKTLVSAQFQADETKANARKESELILRDAELKARGIVSDSYSEVQKVQQALVQLKHLEEDFRYKFRSLLQGHLKLLAEAPINMPAGQAVMVDAAPPVVEPAVPADEPVTAETPFVIPAAIVEVPEYPPLAATAVRPEPPVAPEVVVPNAAAAALEPAPAAVVVEPEPILQQAPVAEARPGAEPSLLWPEEAVAASTDDTPTMQQAAVFASMDIGEDVTRSDVPARPLPGMSDESVTLVTDEDPLKGFFFSPKQDGTADGLVDADKGGKSKARDFEW
jgi:cell division initiation protein